MPPVAPLVRLLEKYRVLAALRLRRESAERAGRSNFDPREAHQRRRAFRGLALEFPGALRELEISSAARLAARAQAIEETLQSLARDPDAPIALWIEVSCAYHSRLREALILKRRLAPHGALDDALIAELGLERAELERHLHPPGGRLQALIWDDLSKRWGRPAHELERLVFG